MLDAIGMSTVSDLTYRAYDASGDEVAGPSGPTIEIETPEGKDVWTVELTSDLVAWELALGARYHFGLKDQYYRIRHKPSGRDLDPKVIVRSAVAQGDRLALVPHGLIAWGWEPKRHLPFRVRRWMRDIIKGRLQT